MFERLKNINGYEICPGNGNICFVDVRRKKGWKEYQKALSASNGLGIIIAHPLYSEVVNVLAVDRDTAPHLIKYLKNYEWAFNNYRNRLRSMFRNKAFSKLPIFILNDPKVKLDDLIPFFGLENEENKRRIFFATTHPTSPLPKFEEYWTEKPMIKFAQKLHKMGLKSTVVAGTYFGGEKRFGNEYLPVKNENNKLPQTTLQRLIPRGCVGSVLTALSSSGIFTVCSNAIFPQTLPSIKNIYRFDFGESEKSEIIIDSKSSLSLGVIIPDDIY